jgi:hypothetical protein
MRALVAACIVAISNRRGRAVPETATPERTAMRDVLSADAGVAAMKVEGMYVVAVVVAVPFLITTRCLGLESGASRF